MSQCHPIAFNAAATTSTRRGVCPSLAAPMQTGDGLLTRLRPLGGSLTPEQFACIASQAMRHGNGILEITARGNLQVRGLTADSAPLFSDAVLAMDLPLASGVAIETPPLSGLDPDEVTDARGLAAELAEAVAACEPPLALAAKLSITVDGGGRFHLGGVAADIRLSVEQRDGALFWRLTLAGDATGAQTVALLPEGEVIGAVLGMLRTLSAMGRKARGRDLDLQEWRTHFSAFAAKEPAAAQKILPPPGVHHWRSLAVLGLGLPFCQIDARTLIAFMSEMDAIGCREIRLAPDHGFFLSGIEPAHLEAARERAMAHGFITRPDDPANAIALCAGSRGCASAFFDTHALAGQLIAQGEALLDGSLTVHLSGCPKGCAHPAAAALTITAAPTGYVLVVNGSASVSPDAYIAAKDVAAALAALGRLARDNRQAGESAAGCLTRLGRETILDAVRRVGE